MAKPGKRAKLISEKIEPGKLYPVEEALTLLSEVASPKFSESVDVSINLGVDPRSITEWYR